MIYEIVDIKERGRPVNPPEYMIALLIYGALRHIGGTDELAEMAEFHQKFRYVSGDLKPSGRVLRKFMHEYGNLFKQLLASTLTLAYNLGLTDFDYVCVDRTIIKAIN
jgi:transposase